MRLYRNLHVVDRLLRLLIGVGCCYIGFIDQSIIGNTLASMLVGIFGVINLFAGFTAYCPVYGLTGITTWRQGRRKRD